MMPEAELGEHETGVWALAASEVGATIVTGTDEGAVNAWDLRARRAIWQARTAHGRQLCARIPGPGTAASCPGCGRCLGGVVKVHSYCASHLARNQTRRYCASQSGCSAAPCAGL